ncbi:cobalt-zinc-cadmium resistance protein CzcB [mine drainage metagenome]|uniref:Cobalt-zinc-cadmium resistance protein CzcB n=1 Tax=mine drainage metagenome TaxID=410659 RepID=A0A1J5QKK2_9ZZZZ
MNKNMNMNIATFVVLGMYAVIAFAGGGDVIAMTQKQQQALGIVVAPVSASSALSSNRLPGEITVPVGQERVVSAPQAGLVDALYVAAGQSVRKGQALAHITSTELVALQRDYLQALTQHRLARTTLERDAELYKDGIIAERRYLTTKSSHEELVALLAQRRQALKLAGMGEAAIARLESRGELTSGLTISAPIEGQVLEQMVTIGQRIDPAMPILRIGRLNPLWLEIHAPIEALGTVANGMSVRIPKYQAEGKVIAVIRNVNRNDQTMHVRAEITRNADKLSPGQFVEAEIVAEGVAGRQFSVPRNAVVRSGAESYVFVQTVTGFMPRKVGVASEQADRVVISGGLNGTEKVAVTGTVAIKAAWVGTGAE